MDFSADENINIGDELLDSLTKFSPKSLIGIMISVGWKYSINSFEQFFESFRGRTLNWFEFVEHKNDDYIAEDYKVIVRKYIKEGVILRSTLYLE